MGHFLSKFNLCVEQCEKCSHRRPIIWWKPNFFCPKVYSPKTKWFVGYECKLYEVLQETIPPKKFSGFHLI